jgi:hypothetical protein
MQVDGPHDPAAILVLAVGGDTLAAFRGTLTQLSGVDLERSIVVLGYNHNLQSSFGVTTSVKKAIAKWVSAEVSEVQVEPFRIWLLRIPEILGQVESDEADGPRPLLTRG